MPPCRVRPLSDSGPPFFLRFWQSVFRLSAYGLIGFLFPSLGESSLGLCLLRFTYLLIFLLLSFAQPIGCGKRARFRARFTQTKANENLWDFTICFVSVACCCGLCVPNMIIMKANAKENLREFICLSTTKAKAK